MNINQIMADEVAQRGKGRIAGELVVLASIWAGISVGGTIAGTPLVHSWLAGWAAGVCLNCVYLLGLVLFREDRTGHDDASEPARHDFDFLGLLCVPGLMPLLSVYQAWLRRPAQSLSDRATRHHW